MSGKGEAIVAEVRAWGLTLPGAHRKSPWPEHDDLAVKDKTFAYLPAKGRPFSLSCKLPYTGYEALQLSFAKPTGYGLGKAGWVTVRFGKREKAPVALLRSWIDESYRAVAPKKLVAALSASASSKPGKVSATTGRTSASPKTRRTRKPR